MNRAALYMSGKKDNTKSKTYIGRESELAQGEPAVLVEVFGPLGHPAHLLVGEGGPRVHVVVDDHLQDGAPEQRFGRQLEKSASLQCEV